MSHNYRGGGGGGGGRSGGRGGRSGGRTGRGGGRGGGDHGPTVVPAKFRPCKSWLQSGSCPNGTNCHYAHIVQLHATVDASSYVPQSQSNNKPSYHGNNPQGGGNATKAQISSVAIWETPAAPPPVAPTPQSPQPPPPQAPSVIKIFTGSHDGYWRLFNTAQNFLKEFENKVGMKVDCLHISHNFLFCGMQAIPPCLPDTPVGMVHVWNLQQPNVPPLELQLDPKFLPYAHNQSVSALTVRDTSVVTGAKDGSIRIWTFSNNAFVLDKSLGGHAREVTGLVTVIEQNHKLLWSGSTDGSIRIWDMTTGACQYSISKKPPKPMQGHSSAVSALESFESPGAGTFVLSASLDGTVKAWKATTGECVASENHGEGVVSLAIANYHGDIPLLLVGLVSGNIVCRNLVPNKGGAAAFEALFVLTNRFNMCHYGSVRCIQAGPQGTFYTGGTDGNLMVWQINGDLGLK